MTHSPGRAPPDAALDLLRACLATAERPRHESWAALTDVPGVLRDPRIRHAGLMPMLLHAAGVAGVGLDPELRSVCRAARVHEDLRLEATAPACRDALNETPQTPPIVLRGVAFAHTIYDEPALRHCHDIDLLVTGAEGASVHPSGFPISRHRTLFVRTPVTVTWERIVADTIQVDVGGIPANTLHPADALVHACVHAPTNGRGQAPLWCIDAALLARRLSPLDWQRVVERALEWNVAPQLYATLGWLERGLGVELPERVVTLLAWRRARARHQVRVGLKRLGLAAR